MPKPAPGLERAYGWKYRHPDLIETIRDPPFFASGSPALADTIQSSDVRATAPVGRVRVCDRPNSARLGGGPGIGSRRRIIERPRSLYLRVTRARSVAKAIRLSLPGTPRRIAQRRGSLGCMGRHSPALASSRPSCRQPVAARWYREEGGSCWRTRHRNRSREWADCCAPCFRAKVRRSEVHSTRHGSPSCGGGVSPRGRRS